MSGDTANATRRGRALAANDAQPPKPKRAPPICGQKALTAAQKQAVSQEILLWMTPSENLTALQTSVCSELLSPTRAD